jgi:hypothetical protein
MHCQLPKPRHQAPRTALPSPSLKPLSNNCLTGVRFFQVEWLWNCSGESGAPETARKSIQRALEE